MLVFSILNGISGDIKASARLVNNFQLKLHLLGAVLMQTIDTAVEL